MKRTINLSLAFATLLSLLLFALALATIATPQLIAYANDRDDLSESIMSLLVDSPNFSYNDNMISINGNYTQFDKTEIKNIISNPSKIHIFYDINTNDNISSDTAVLNNNACIYYYKNGIPHTDTFMSSENDDGTRFLEVKCFISEKIKQINNQVSLLSDDSHSQIFNTLYSGTMRRNGKPYGYIDIDWTIKKYRTNDISSLYLVESHAAFTPGAVAIANDSSGYQAWRNISGYLHITPRRAQFEVGYGQTRYGGTPVFKDAYPLNNPGTITITSSYNIGTTLGFSYKNGFSLDNISIGQDLNLGLNISYAYNKSYTTTEPALSTQRNASNPQTYEWSYTYSSARSETNHLLTGYMFEMNNTGHDLYEDDLSFKYDYKMTVQQNNTTKSFSHYYIVEYV